MRIAPLRLLVAVACMLPTALPAQRASVCALDPPSPPADTFPIEARRERVALILRNARVYSLQWGEPRFDGTPSPSAPYDQGRWRPDAGAIAIGDRRIIAVGSDSAILALREAGTVVRDLRGATVLPGLVDAHTHVAELGASLARVDLVGVRSTAEAMARVAAAARGARPGAWILGQGWDEGAWADTVLTARALSARFPRNPVYLRGLHGFSGWANRAALARAGITRETPDPTGGVIDRDADGTPAGRVRNRAVKLLDDAIPPPTLAEAESHWLLGLQALARAGYTTIHEAGVDRVHLAALRSLASQCRLPIRVYAMVSTRDSAAVREWLARGPDTSGAGGVTVRAAKAYYDGALGSRGARLFADYADLPGHLGVAGAAYGFDSAAVAAMMRRGFQVGIHAIGDAGNDEVLDFLARVQATVERPALRRDRIEHAQVMARSTTHRVRDAGVIPSMQPVHAVEDAPWVVARIGAERATGAYAWRALRRVGLAPAFGSDLPGSGFGIGYGLHAATTRTDTLGAPPGGWYPDQRLTIEEAVRGFTIWAQRAAFVETRRGMIAPGYDADLTVLDADPFDPATRLPALRVRAVIVGGRLVEHDAGARRPRRAR